MQPEHEELKAKFLAAATGDTKLAHVFFEGFPFIKHYSSGDHLGVLNSAIEVLTALKDLDLPAYEKIHKGFIFYFTAISCFFLHDYQTGTFFFDAAVSEDFKNDQNPRTPAMLFMLLESENPKQAAQSQTKHAKDWLTLGVAEYALLPDHVALTFADVQQHFLEKAITDHKEWRTLVTSFNTFYLEWGYRFQLLNLRIENGTWEMFYLHLFKGCLLFESLLKSNPNIAITQPTLGRILNDNAVKARLRVTRHLNSTATLPTILSDLPGAAFDIQTDLETTLKLRNTLGHNLAWDEHISNDQYSALARKISNSCLHVISTLYR